ncbi:hypothetical protein [Mycobacteroides abscessus]
MDIDKAYYKNQLATNMLPIVMLAALQAAKHNYVLMGAYSDEIQMFCQTIENTAVRMVEQYSGLDD